MISKIKEKVSCNLISQLVKFSITGVIGVTFNYSIFFILYRFFHVYYILASATGFALGILLVFFINKEFTFKIKGYSEVKKMILKYYTLNIILAIIGLTLLSFFVEILNINVYIANALILLITALLHFTGSKFLVFIQNG